VYSILASPSVAPCWVEYLDFRVQGSGFRVQGSGFRVQDKGCEVRGAGFKIKGVWGFGDWGGQS